MITKNGRLRTLPKIFALFVGVHVLKSIGFIIKNSAQSIGPNGRFCATYLVKTRNDKIKITSFRKNGDKMSSIFCWSISMIGGAYIFSARTQTVSVKNSPIFIFEQVF